MTRRYILDPAEVYGPDFPGGTSRVLKEKDQVKSNQCSACRLVVEAGDRVPMPTVRKQPIGISWRA